MKRKKDIIKVCVIFLTFVSILITPILGANYNKTQKVEASEIDELYKQLEELEKQLTLIKQQKIDLGNKIDQEQALQGSLTVEINNLSNNISKLELDIKEKEVEIEKKETKIKILEEDITEKGLLIDNIKGDVKDLQLTANDIVKTIYVDSKTNSIIDILLNAGVTESFFSQIQYHTALGTYDKNALETLRQEKGLLEDEKESLEDNKIEVEILAEQVSKQKENLEKDREQLATQKVQKNQMLQNSQVAAAYYGQQHANLSDEEKKKEAELNYVLQQIIQNPTKPKGYAVKGQIIAKEGNNGCSSGPHTHFGFAIGRDNWKNPCTYLPTEQFNWGTCSGTGEIGYPYKNPFYSSRGYTWYHQALDLYAGTDKYVRAAHDGYYFEETPPCSNSWCYVGCNTSTNPCIKLCEDLNCQTGKISIYCHVNFL